MILREEKKKVSQNPLSLSLIFLMCSNRCSNHTTMTEGISVPPPLRNTDTKVVAGSSTHAKSLIKSNGNRRARGVEFHHSDITQPSPSTCLHSMVFRLSGLFHGENELQIGGTRICKAGWWRGSEDRLPSFPIIVILSVQKIPPMVAHSGNYVFLSAEDEGKASLIMCKSSQTDLDLDFVFILLCFSQRHPNPKRCMFSESSLLENVNFSTHVAFNLEKPI